MGRKKPFRAAGAQQDCLLPPPSTVSRDHAISFIASSGVTVGPPMMPTSKRLVTFRLISRPKFLRDCQRMNIQSPIHLGLPIAGPTRVFRDCLPGPIHRRRREWPPPYPWDFMPLDILA